jgi:hypothetical protein
MNETELTRSRVRTRITKARAAYKALNEAVRVVTEAGALEFAARQRVLSLLAELRDRQKTEVDRLASLRRTAGYYPKKVKPN